MEPVKVLFFTSPGCSICDNQDRILRQMQESGEIVYENHLITTAFDVALRFGVRSAPTLVYLLEERPVRVSPGFQSKEAIAAVLNMIQNG